MFSQWLPPNAGQISERSTRRLKFQVPAILLMCALGFIRTSFLPPPAEGSPRGRRTTAVDQEFSAVQPVSRFDEANVSARQLLVSGSCRWDCSDPYLNVLEDGLKSQFIILDGKSQMEFRDPYDCDDIILPTDDDSDDEDCIIELGAGRRRTARESARQVAETSGTEQCIQDDIFMRKGTTCEKQAQQGTVCVKGGAPRQVSSGALPVLRDDKLGLVALYVFLVIYMFIALAIICDEFFVPALECFVDEVGISMDVAGATFMAAGGSMPELFTSLIATFQDSEVGFVAIVGSAVFNVLFVIAVCALASDEPLALTWWPLSRDCSFYVIALITVAIVFSVTSPNKIEAWEAILLLLEYVAYCSFMKFNGRINAWVEQKLLGRQAVTTSEASTDENNGNGSQKNLHANFLKPSTFRAGILQLLTRNTYLYETAGIAAVTQIKGELEETFNSLDTDKSGTLGADEMKVLFEELCIYKDIDQIKQVIHQINRGVSDTINFEDFKVWYISSETRIQAEMKKVFQKFDKDKSGSIDAEELTRCLQSLGHKPTQAESQQMIEELNKTYPNGDPNGDTAGKITFDVFESWYNSSMFYETKKSRNQKQGEEDEAEGLSLEMPEEATWRALLWYFLTYPLCAILYVTLPDVRTAKYRGNAKVAVLEFSLSLVWIGVFSLLLYEAIVIVSNTLKIPVAVSAVTLLAGGTSVPDLLSSYVVAKNGQGDMAVSSSIGSNIFDVTVGLPLPWFAYIIIKWKAFELGPASSKGLFFSLLLLALMLVAVIGTVMACKWKMTKGLGVVMLILYVLYVTQYLLQKLPASCNVNEIGVFQINF